MCNYNSSQSFKSRWKTGISLDWESEFPSVIFTEKSSPICAGLLKILALLPDDQSKKLKKENALHQLKSLNVVEIFVIVQWESSFKCSCQQLSVLVAKLHQASYLSHNTYIYIQYVFEHLRRHMAHHDRKTSQVFHRWLQFDFVSGCIDLLLTLCESYTSHTKYVAAFCCPWKVVTRLRN